MAGVDRISALPGELKVSILSLLSITDAVRTSLLSRSWRHLWTLLPGLRADQHFVRGLNLFPEQYIEDEFSPTPRRLRELAPWIEVVERLLSSLRGPILYFTLSHYTDSHQSPHLRRFLDLIFQKGGLEKFSIYSNSGVALLQIPYFRSLKELHLSWVRLFLPPDFQGFDQLTFLKLYGVRISQHDINALINWSKKLTVFEGRYIFRTDDEDSVLVTFNCPLLKSISFKFKMPLPQARVASAPCLHSADVTASATLYADDEELAGLGAATMKFMADVAHVSHFSLETTVLKCLSRVNVPHTLRVHFRQLRCLSLVGEMSCIDKKMYETFCHLLKSMPCLEFLEIECYYPEEGDELVDPIPLSVYMDKQDGFHCLDQTLRRVVASTFKLNTINDIMWMMYFILLNANVLERLEITFIESDPQTTSSMIEELREVEKASSDAKVVLWDEKRHREY